jgi:hypothetical protein
MATQNLISVELNGVKTDKAEKARTAYRTPDVVAVGAAIKLVQGPMYNATYRDLCNSGYTYFDVI